MKSLLCEQHLTPSTLYGWGVLLIFTELKLIVFHIDRTHGGDSCTKTQKLKKSEAEKILKTFMCKQELYKSPDSWFLLFFTIYKERSQLMGQTENIDRGLLLITGLKLRLYKKADGLKKRWTSTKVMCRGNGEKKTEERKIAEKCWEEVCFTVLMERSEIVEWWESEVRSSYFV